MTAVHVDAGPEVIISSVVHTGQPGDGPMGISVALTPATTTVTVSKSMITNASFRTKKLPGECCARLCDRFIIDLCMIERMI